MPHVEIPQAEFKVVILGDSHIGKTSLVTRFAEGYYREKNPLVSPTVGAPALFVTKRIQATDGTPTKIQIWDTAGANSFEAMASAFYKNAAAIIVCYEVCRRDSYEGMRRRLEEVRRKVRVNEEVIVAIASLKTDLLDNRNVDVSAAVPEYEAEQLAETLGMMYVPTSAKTDRNVQALFQTVADRVLALQTNNPISTANNGDGSRMRGGNNNNNNTIGSGTLDGQLNVNTNLNKVDAISNNHPTTSDRIKTPGTASASSAAAAAAASSPQRRSQFDKYYVSTNSDPNVNDGNDYDHDQNGKVNAMNETNDTASSSLPDSTKSPSKRNKKKNLLNRSSTPSTDGTMTDNEHDANPLLATPEKKKNLSKDNMTCLSEESAYSCQPMACGAGMDGPSGCIVQ
eukprot:CAMPEP_0183708180 /NCGR_PEP_ID=MMETSP0737-20130205/4566_1 /TAXON_ID=385413 /ORGANISM="Thalassiosira miniscula, Strain CCMP1093" /LENGTH=398 /DNA_ID=CAMNT_0025935999 /DNA_START=138 /DNA_END=1334 /DNA_ORIENTATION=+